MFEVIKKFRNLPRNQILKLRLISHLKNKKIMSQTEIKSLPKEIFTKDLVEKYGKYLEDRLDVPQVFEYFLKNDMIDYIPDDLDDNSQILMKCIEYKRYELIDSFFSSAFTKEILKKLSSNEEYIKSIKKITDGLDESIILNGCIEYKRYDLIDSFSSSAFTEEITEKLLQNEDYINNIKTVPFALKDNSKMLLKCVKCGRFDLINQFTKETLTKEVIQKLLDNEDFIKKTTVIPSILLNNFELLQKCIEYKRYDLIDYFSFTIFTEELKEKLIGNDEFVKVMKSVPNVLKDNSKLLQKCIEYGKYDLVGTFFSNIFSVEIIKKLLNSDDFIKKTTVIPSVLSDNFEMLQKCIENKRYDLIDYFSFTVFTEKFKEKLIGNDEFIKVMKSVPNALKDNSKLLQKCIKYKRYELLKYFYPNTFTPNIINLIEDDEEILKNIIEKYFPENFDLLPFFKGNPKLLEKCVEYKGYDAIYSFNKKAFTEEVIDKIFINEKFLNYIIKLTTIPFLLNDNSKLLKKCIEYEKYYLIIKGFKKEAYSKECIDLLSKKLNISCDEMQYKIDYLFNKNNEILSTLDLRLLGKQYNVFDIEFIEKIGNYQAIQEKILKLNETQLLVFSKVSKLLTNNDYDLSYIIEIILDNLVLYGDLQYDKLINSSNENKLTDEQLRNFVYVLKRKNNIYKITDANQLTDSNFKKIKQEYRQKIELLITSRTITNEQIKEAIFEEKFGLNITEVNFIIQRYCHDLDNLENSNINEEVKLILKSLKDISDCDDLNKLINYYNNTDFLLTNFYASIFLESVIRNEYIKEYDKTLYKLDKKHSLIQILHNNPKLNELEHIRSLVNLDVLGKKPKFYILDDDFNMLVHALNAYSKVSKHDNFKEEWEVPLIANHGVCTSYIGNNQIAIARIKSVVLGFSNLEGGSIYRAANYDMGSNNSELSISSTSPDNFLLPNKMIDNTRHTHNEIVIERRGAKSSTTFKRMPDYLVLFVDDINDSNNFDPSINEHYKYTLQASIDFDIPIVIVDRLKYAKREHEKCEKLLIEFSNSFDNNKLNELLLTFFNNAIGCKCYDVVEHEYNKIFNQNSFDNLYQRIIDIVEKQDNFKKLNLFSKLLSYLEIEKGKQGNEITINLEEKINLLKDKIEELKKHKMADFIKIYNLEDFERILLSIPVQSNDNNDFIILYSNNVFKVDLSKASFKKVPELAEASFLNRMKLLEALSGKYIPICDLNDNVLFTEEEYNKIRQKMSGLKQYNTGNFIFSDNLYFPQLDEYLTFIDDNLKSNNVINNLINNNVMISLSNIGLVIGKDVELINTGSTARGTNLPNDIDFDYVMKIDLNKIDIIKQNLLVNLPCIDKIVMENRIRLKQVKIEGLDQLVDIDITFVSKEKYYSSDTALAERLEQIKEQDYEKYRLVLANIMYAKKILQDANVYKASRSDKTQAGLGGIGVENWILQNGGSLLDAANEFLEYSKDIDFIDFEKKYFVNDYGKNHVSITRNQFPYDNYIMKNMREHGYIKMRECLEQFVQNIENDISKKR